MHGCGTPRPVSLFRCSMIYAMCPPNKQEHLSEKTGKGEEMINTLVTFHVQPSQVHEFESLHRALLQSMIAQNGCIEIRALRSLKTPQEYVVYGTWESKEAWDHAHQTD